MKKLVIIGIILLLASSCVKHPNIILKISEEEAAAIPYELGQTVKFLNQDGDTLSFQVLRDQTYPYNGEQYYNAIFGGDVYHPSRYYCYARTVVLDREEGGILGFTILPQKEFYFFYFVNGSNFELNCHLSPNSSYQINNTNYEQVHHEILCSQDSDETLYDWYYSEELGLLYFKKGNFSLTRIP